MDKIATKEALKDLATTIREVLDTKQDTLTIDTELNTQSQNPVTNSAIATAIGDINTILQQINGN